MFYDDEFKVYTYRPNPDAQKNAISRSDWESSESLLLYRHAKFCEELNEPLKYWEDVNYAQMAIEIHESMEVTYTKEAEEWKQMQDTNSTEGYRTFYHYLYYKLGFYDWNNVCAMLVKVCLLDETARAVMSRAAPTKKDLKQYSHLGDGVADTFFSFVTCASGAHKKVYQCKGDAILNDFYHNIGRLLGLHRSALADTSTDEYNRNNHDYVGDIFETLLGIALDLGYWPLLIFCTVGATHHKFYDSATCRTFPRAIVNAAGFDPSEANPGTYEAFMKHWEQLHAEQVLN